MTVDAERVLKYFTCSSQVLYVNLHLVVDTVFLFILKLSPSIHLSVYLTTCVCLSY